MCPIPIERDTYRQSLARLLRVDERRLPGEGGFTRRPARRASSEALRRSPPWSRCAAPPPAATPWKPLPWASCCAVPTCSTGSTATCRSSGCSASRRDDFQHADHRAILRLLQESIDQDVAEPLNHVLNSLSLPMMEMADGLLARTAKLDPNDERVLGDLLRGSARHA